MSTDFPGGLKSRGASVLTAVGGVPHVGKTWWVDGTNGSDGYKGTKSGKAFATIQAAVTAQIAGTSSLGDIIYVLPGTYAESVTASAFDDVSLIGARDSVIIAPTTGHAFLTGTDGTAAASMNRSVLKNIEFRAPSTEDATTAYSACCIGWINKSVIEDCRFMGTTVAPYQNPGPATVGLQLGHRTYTEWQFPEFSRISRCEFGTSAGRTKELSIGILVGSQTNTTPSYNGFKSMVIEDCVIGAYDTGILLNYGAASGNGSVIRRNVITSHQGGDGVNEGIVNAADDGTDTVTLIADNKIQAISDCIKNFAAGNTMNNIVSVGNATPDTEYHDGS